MCAFAVLQLAHQRRVSFAPRLTADARLSAPVRTTTALPQTQLHVSVEKLPHARQRWVSSATPPAVPALMLVRATTLMAAALTLSPPLAMLERTI